MREGTSHEGGDHLLFLGHVIEVAYRDDTPLIFTNGRYCTPATLRFALILPRQRLQRRLKIVEVSLCC